MFEAVVRPQEQLRLTTYGLLQTAEVKSGQFKIGQRTGLRVQRRKFRLIIPALHPPDIQVEGFEAIMLDDLLRPYQYRRLVMQERQEMERFPLSR